MDVWVFFGWCVNMIALFSSKIDGICGESDRNIVDTKSSYSDFRSCWNHILYCYHFQPYNTISVNGS